MRGRSRRWLGVWSSEFGTPSGRTRVQPACYANKRALTSCPDRISRPRTSLEIREIVGRFRSERYYPSRSFGSGREQGGDFSACLGRNDAWRTWPGCDASDHTLALGMIMEPAAKLLKQRIGMGYQVMREPCRPCGYRPAYAGAVRSQRQSGPGKIRTTAQGPG